MLLLWEEVLLGEAIISGCACLPRCVEALCHEDSEAPLLPGVALGAMPCSLSAAAAAGSGRLGCCACGGASSGCLPAALRALCMLLLLCGLDALAGRAPKPGGGGLALGWEGLGGRLLGMYALRTGWGRFTGCGLCTDLGAGFSGIVLGAA